MALIRKIDQALARLERLLIVGLFSALIGLITFNIISRNLFGTSFQELLEVLPGLVMWLALLGATLGLKHQRHIKLEVLLRHLNPVMVRAARSITNCCAAGLMAILFAAALIFVKNEVGIFGPRGWMSLVFPLFFALTGLRFLIAGMSSGDDRDSNYRPGGEAAATSTPDPAAPPEAP